MRKLASLRLVAPVLLAAALVLVPVTSHAAPAATRIESLSAEQVAGVYRLVLGTESRGARVVHLLLQQTSRGFDGMLLSDANDAALSDVKFDGSTLTAIAQTSTGTGVLRLAVSEHGVTGTFTVGKRVFVVNGEKA